MAMIKCPECGQEISDKAKKCIHCGKVFVDEEVVKAEVKCNECGTVIMETDEICPNCGCPVEKNTEPQISDKSVGKHKKNTTKIIAIVIVAVVIMAAIIGGIVYNEQVVKPKKIEAQNKATYEEAIELLEKGKYDDANDLLKSISDYKNVPEIREELKYESCAYSAVNAIKEILKNPDSISVYDVKFYSGRESSQKDDNTETEENNTLIDAEHPYIIIHMGAENGFGGTTESYASCIYNKDDDKYQLDSYTNELDVDELDEDSDNYFLYLLGATLISGYYDDGIEVGTIDMSRFKTVLKNDAYSTIKIIE